MSVFSALLFSWVQSAPAYRRLHADAIGQLGPGGGRTWIDVGCGPGLVAELAAASGFTVDAIDTNSMMVRLVSRRSSRAAPVNAWVADANDPLPPHDVVSAASLLCQLPDPAAGIQTLWSAVEPGGALLIIETTDKMSPDAVRRAAPDADRHSRRVLHRWATAREGSALSPALWDALPKDSTTCVPLLDGCVVAVIAHKPTGHPEQA